MGLTLSYQSAVDTIYHWHSNPPEQLIFDRGQTEITRYLEAVVNIQQSPVNGTESDELNAMAMGRLKREFLIVLARQTYNLSGPNSTSESSNLSSVTDSTGNVIRYEDYSAYNLPSDEVIVFLKNVAEIMSSGGKLGDCAKVYKSARRDFFRTILKPLCLEELKFVGDAKRFPRNELKMKIELWVQAAKICFNILFEMEKQFTGQIFSGLGTGTDEECFMEMVKDSANNLLIFAAAVSSSNQPWERMDIILRLYDTLLSILPKIYSLFDSESESAEAIRSRTAAAVYRVEDDVRRMLSDFENALFHELLPISDDRGAVHGSTEYAMNYIDLIVGHRKLLTDLINSMPPLKFKDQMIPEGELGNVDGRSNLELHLILIIVVLQQNLKGKSEQYQHVALRHLFVMNNVRYIVQKIEGSKDLREMIGDDYVERLNRNVTQAMTSYKVLTCDKFLSCFQDRGLSVTWCFSSRVSKRTLKKRLKAFNLAFEEMRLLHSHWRVPDLELQDRLRVTMVDWLIPAYKEFLNKFQSYIEIEKHRDVQMKRFRKINVRHSVEDLQALISKDLFSHSEIIV